MKLADYRKKRDPKRTNEPLGGDPQEAAAPTMLGAYVVHLHDATRKHYDLRLETAGVLASFAVPKGPSLDPESKHLAVKTEDHPLEYLDFEEVIPEGLYGAGPMIAWDRGSARYLEASIEDGIRDGKIDFVLNGRKLHGRFALVRLKKSETEWLLLKKRDAYSSKEKDIITLEPRSIFSGLTVEELTTVPAISAGISARAKKLGAPEAKSAMRTADLARWAVTRKEMRGDGWVYEVLLDGVRVLATREGEKATLRHAEHDVSAFYPEVIRALLALPADDFSIDARLVAFDEEGRPNVTRLARRLELFRADDGHRAELEVPVTLIASDLLALAGRDTRRLPLSKRKELLHELVRGKGIIHVLDEYDGDPKDVLAFSREHNLDGIVAKKTDSPYAKEPGENGWLLMPTAREGAPPRELDHTVAPQRSKKAVTVTNRTKIFWPEEGYTKGDLVDYYRAIAPAILPYLADRPIVLVRYPDGIAGKNFFQWNVPPGMPSWMTSIKLKETESKEKRVFIVNDIESLSFVANLGCIPMHLLACRTSDLESLDFLTIDFDVKLSSLAAAVTLAHTLRELLHQVGLEGFAKTSGQTGLHVLVPLGEGISFTAARVLAELLGRLLVKRHPKTATMERIVSKRGAQVYVDTGQTGRARTIVSPYSVRAAPGATVSAPLAWKEVTAKLDPKKFTIRTVPERFAKIGDPMLPMLAAKPDVPNAIARLEPLIAALGESG